MSSNPLSYSRLVSLVDDFKTGNEMLVLRILMVMTETIRPSEKLVEVVKKVVIARKLNIRFIAPIMSGLTKSEILFYLPQILSLLDGTPDRKKFVSDVIVRMATTENPSIDAIELFITINNLEDAITLKKTMEGNFF